ncbi:MAG: hypothetical protein U0U46_21425 [Saprospiraceae bacterium]|nr:hypothetical protein [Saprospiraceae bacterium]
MNKFAFLFFTLTVWFAACQAPEDKNAAALPTSPPASALPPSGYYFTPGKAGMIKGELQDGDWCKGDFSESVVVNPDRDDYNKRWFYLGNGVHKIIVSGSKGASSFMLRKSGDRSVEVLTSTQFPMCLSSRKNFDIKDFSTQWGYDNQGGGIIYKVGVVADNNWPRIDIYLPPEGAYGMAVYRCVNCQ